MVHILKRETMTAKELAEELGAKADTVEREVRRNKSQFTVIDGGKIALLTRWQP